MSEIKLEDLGRVLSRDLRRLEKAIEAALEDTGDIAVDVIKSNVPVAHKELQSSISNQRKPGQISISVNAPHAAAVEVGSRPHTPPIEPLLAWVKLRGMQGLTKTGRIIRQPKVFGRPSSKQLGKIQARHVAISLSSHVSGGAMDVSAPMQVARAIQRAISVSGTKPSHYVRRSLPKIIDSLHENILTELHKIK